MAAHLNRSPRTFRKYVDEYRIPHIRLGRDLLFDPREVADYLKSQSAAAAAAESSTPQIPLASRPARKRHGQKPADTALARRLGL
jgi:hypothetical protein